jgi:hypothetical protein
VVGAALLALLAVNCVVPVGTLAFDSRLPESVVCSRLLAASYLTALATPKTTPAAA